MSLDQEAQQIFADRLKSAQPQIYVYICALIMNANDALDILQETNSVLWKKAERYDPNKPFIAWAYRFARFQTMAFLKRRKRDRLVFNSEFIAQTGEYAEQDANIHERRLKAMELCVAALPENQRLVIEAKYYRGEGVALLAQRLKKEPNTVSALLYRIRAALAKCIQTRLAAIPEEYSH